MSLTTFFQSVGAAFSAAEAEVGVSLSDFASMATSLVTEVAQYGATAANVTEVTAFADQAISTVCALLTARIPAGSAEIAFVQTALTNAVNAEIAKIFPNSATTTNSSSATSGTTTQA